MGTLLHSSSRWYIPRTPTREPLVQEGLLSPQVQQGLLRPQVQQGLLSPHVQQGLLRPQVQQGLCAPRSNRVCAPSSPTGRVRPQYQPSTTLSKKCPREIAQYTTVASRFMDLPHKSTRYIRGTNSLPSHTHTMFSRYRQSPAAGGRPTERFPRFLNPSPGVPAWTCPTRQLHIVFEKL
jgi:hypothetical protein